VIHPGEYTLVCNPELDTAIRKMPEWLGLALIEDTGRSGWYRHRREWHFVQKNAMTLCGKYQIFTREELLEQPDGGGVCRMCKSKSGL
jgi:hypothetical protein